MQELLTNKRGYCILILACILQAEYLREWLSGGAQPCQGWGRGFDPRLALEGKGLEMLIYSAF